MNFSIIDYQDLDKNTLYQIIQLRIQVFVVDQKSIYQDLDGKDLSAKHACLMHNNTIVAYARIIEPEKDSIRFGRVLTAPTFRRQGYGKQLMTQLMKALQRMHNGKTLTIEAQSYLISFYKAYGFSTQGNSYLLDGISHTTMMQLL